ncbi:MAG: NAD(P)-dependent alcohol dehydrogenase [Polyangiaceae bacterium]
MRALAQHEVRGLLEWVDLPEPELGTDTDVIVDVSACSLCHSDLHLLDGDWGPQKRPFVPGHEIVGRVVRAGVAVRDRFPNGKVVGIGWQAGSCGTCFACTSGRAHLCAVGKVRTCVGRAGGFAERVVCDARFCFPLPETLDPKECAPLLCAGVTVFSPLERFRVGPGAKVGVVGLGGLGHLAVRFACAFGADVLAFDPDLSKADLARTLGARDLVDAKAALPDAAVDLLLVTTHASLPWDRWMRVLRLEGTLCLVGIPDAPLSLGVDPLLDEQKSVTGSVIGSPETMSRMLAFASEKRVAPIVEHAPLREANAAASRLRSGQARMRIVLHRDADL